MIIATIVAALLGALIIHEAAHALVLRSFGIPICAAGLGLPIAPMARFRVPRVPFEVTVSPWLLGAYVMPDPGRADDVRRLSYREHAWFLNAGILANLGAGMALIGVARLLGGSYGWAAILLIMASVIWFARRSIAAYVVPALAIPILVLFGWFLSISWSQGHSGFGFAGLDEALNPGATEALAFFGAINIAVALSNMLPLFGLDNGKVVGLILERWMPRRGVQAYEVAGLVVVAGMLLTAVSSDAWALIQAVFG